MTAKPTCPCCGQPMADGAYACVRDGIDRPARLLEEIADMTPAARDVARRLSSTQTGGGGSGKPGSSLPLDLGATAKLDGVLAALTRWIDHIGPIRGHTRPWFEPGRPDDDLITAARWLTRHLEWMRHRDNVAGFLADIEAAARIVRGIARGRREQKYLGPCGALPEIDITELADQFRPAPLEPQPCDGDVYGPAGGPTGTCRTCGAQVDQHERRIWLDEQVRDQQLVARASLIADAYGINVNTIRTWATEVRAGSTVIRAAKLRSYWRAGEHVVPWAEPKEGEDVKARGPRLYYVADVLDLARNAAARRAENEARRASSAA